MKQYLFLFIILMLGQQLTSREYIVATYGNNQGPGTLSEPFASLQQACYKAQAGDTITIRGGEYYIEHQIMPENSGRPDAWITIRNMPGEIVIIDGQYLQTVGQECFSCRTAGLLQITSKEYIRVKGLRFRNSYSVGILVGYSPGIADAAPEEKRNTRHILIEECSVDRTYNSGISLWYADYVTVNGCEVVRANDIDYRLPQAKKGYEAPHEAISVCGARHFIISNNHVYHCYKEGIDCKEVSSYGLICNNIVHDVPRQAYYADAWFGLLEDIEFCNNIAYSSGWGFAVSVEGKDSEARNIRIHHNLVYNMKGAGILFGLWGENRLRSDIHIYNNTIYQCGSADWFSGNVGSIDLLSVNCKDVYIYNNICDQGFEYELGFGFDKTRLPDILRQQNIIVNNNLLSGIKNKPVRIGQFGVRVIEYIPEGNQIGSTVYRNSAHADFVPLQQPEPERKNIWKYEPSPWYGAYRPINLVSSK